MPLVSSLKRSRQHFEITEHGTPVAVLLDYQSYQELISQQRPQMNIANLKGSVKILGDLEQARRDINREFRKSIERRSADL